MSSLFYFFYLLRRLQFLVTQVYFNPVSSFQLSLNVGFSFFYLVYLVSYRPFKDISIMISHICAEFCLLCNFSIILVLVLDIWKLKLKYLEFGFISSVYFSMMIQFSVILYNNFLSIKKLIVRANKEPKIGVEGNS